MIHIETNKSKKEKEEIKTMENKKFEALNMKELEELSIYGGSEGEGTGRSAVASIVVSASITLSEALSVATALSGVTVAFSALISCSNHCKK